MEQRKVQLLWSLGAVIAVLLFFLVISCGTIDEGERGIKVTFGKMHSEISGPGFYFVTPFVTSMKKYSIQTIREDSHIETYTKDIQPAKIDISVSYHLKQTEIKKIYSQYGSEYRQKLVWNYLTQSIKDIVGRYDAEHMIEMREAVSSEIIRDVRIKTEGLPIEFVSFQLLDITYSKEFELAIENKVIAAQKAKEAENKTVQVKEEAEQRIISAKAEAESMRIRANALASNHKLISYEIAKKWNGKLPDFVGGNSIPMIDLKSLSEGR